MQGIFISYRRQDSQSAAGRLADDLKKNLAGVSVFRDVETIQPGMDFVDVINQALQSCGVLLAVIGPRWISAQDSAGRRRLDNPDDFTRLEIATALKRSDVRVIPVLVEGAQMPEPGDLPEDLRALARRNALELTDNRWNYDVSRLVVTVRQALGVSEPTPEPPGPQWRWLAAAISALVVAGYMVWQWRTPPVPAITPSEAALPTSAPAVTLPTPPIAQNSHTSASDHSAPKVLIPQVGGTWQIIQSGSLVGTLRLSQNETVLSGKLVWNTLAPATLVSGEVSESSLRFVVRYDSGVEGDYKGKLNASFDRVEGVARGQGQSAVWEASRQQ